MSSYLKVIVVFLLLFVVFSSNVLAISTPSVAFSSDALAAPTSSVAFSSSALVGHPFRGSVKWSVLLCKFSDSPPSSRTPLFWREMMLTQDTGGVADYWRDVSYGNFNLNGSVVKGWYDEPITVEQAKARSRDQKFQGCINAARKSKVDPYDPPSDHRIAVVTNPDTELFGLQGVGAFLPVDTQMGFILHETGHGLGLNHSFSNDPSYRNADWAQFGEYDDPWDIMSYANAFAIKTSRFSYGGPGLNAHHVDRMGWLPHSRILTFGADGVRSRTVKLAALNHPETAGFLLIRVPFDPGDLFHYYTVEFRQRDGWDGGIPDDIVLIHEVKAGADGQYYSYLLRDLPSRDPIRFINANGVSINISMVSNVSHQATISISSGIVDRCLLGYVWRGAIPSDLVCVTRATYEQTQLDNLLAPTRVDPNGGPYGPDTCLVPYVWRGVVPSDHVCVTQETYQQVRDDNAQAENRRNPARFVYGPNTCKQGFVWRGADDGDWVCVTRATYEQTQLDNLLAPTRVDPNGGPYGPDTCLVPYVWRGVAPDDHVCVTRETYQQVIQDNAAANSRLAKP